MRKITSDIQAAIRSRSAFKGANTRITVQRREDGFTVTSVYLHGHLVAQCGRTGWAFCFRGYLTNTTRDRINAVRGAVGLPLVGFVKGVPTVEGKAVPSDDWF